MPEINYEKSKKVLDKIYIEKLFHKKKKFYFPNRGKILNIEIKKISPDWAKKDYLVRYRVSFSDGEEIIRGTARADNSKKRAYNFMKYLWEHGFDKGNLRVSRPLDYLKATGLFLYQEAPGKIFYQILANRNFFQITMALKLIASWLAKLHNLSVPSEKVINSATFIKLNGYLRIFQKIKKYFPALSDYLIADQRLLFINKIWRDNWCLIHNDFYPGNIIVENSRIWGIDFNRSGQGPFLMDLATIYGALEFPPSLAPICFTQSQIKKLQKIFLKSYCQTRNLKYLSIEKQLKPFLVKIFLDQIHYHSSFAFEGWREWDERSKLETGKKLKEIFQKIKKYLN